MTWKRTNPHKTEKKKYLRGTTCFEGKNVLESYWQLLNSNSLKQNVKRKTYKIYVNERNNFIPVCEGKHEFFIKSVIYILDFFLENYIFNIKLQKVQIFTLY